MFHAKYQNYLIPGIHYAHFPELGGLLQGPGYCGLELEVEVKKHGWQSFSSHGIIIVLPW